jgi:hypothetical protein
MGLFYPIVFLPSFASLIGLSSLNDAILVAIMSIGHVSGQSALGCLSDKTKPVAVLAVGCSLITVTATFTLWGMAHSTAFLVVFSLIYGFFAFGFGTLRVAMGRAVSDDGPPVFAMYAIFAFLQGIENILVGPLSASLITRRTDTSTYGGGST